MPGIDVPLDRHLLLVQVFRAMDADGNGFIDPMEFKSIFSDVSEKHSNARLREIDGVRDRSDMDGRLSEEEFTTYMLEYLADRADPGFTEQIDQWKAELAKSHRKLLLRRGASDDARASPRRAWSEGRVTATCSCSRPPAAVFERMDTDKSGSVSLQEFKALSDMEVGTENSAAYFRWIESATGNNDGQLTPNEWVPFVLEVRPTCPARRVVALRRVAASPCARHGHRRRRWRKRRATRSSRRA
jgi:Ca2+-binding EF-hand superfamily protein